jgi:hypothetical protein
MKKHVVSLAGGGVVMQHDERLRMLDYHHLQRLLPRPLLHRFIGIFRNRGHLFDAASKSGPPSLTPALRAPPPLPVAAVRHSRRALADLLKHRGEVLQAVAGACRSEPRKIVGKHRRPPHAEPGHARHHIDRAYQNRVQARATALRNWHRSPNVCCWSSTSPRPQMTHAPLLHATSLGHLWRR